MKFDIITIFPNIFTSYFAESIVARAQKDKLVQIKTHDLRDFTDDSHKTVDDRPYGGGAGMVMMPGPIFKAVDSLKKEGRVRKILFSAKGKQFTQADARRLSKYDQLIMVCGRYEGVDQRVAENLVDEEVAVGPYVLTGGEIPAMIVTDAIVRLLPGVLGNKESLDEESFSSEGYLEYPQYTRPENFKGLRVPEALLSGDHKRIKKWREKNSKNKKPANLQ